MNKKNKSVKFEKFFANYLPTHSNTVGKINLFIFVKMVVQKQ